MRARVISFAANFPSLPRYPITRSISQQVTRVRAAMAGTKESRLTDAYLDRVVHKIVCQTLDAIL